MNMRKIIAVLSAALLLCAAIPMGALTVVAAPGDVIIDADFNDGMDGFNNFSVADGALVLDGTSADWANSYAYANNIKPGTTYQVNFRAKADVEKGLAFKINNGWSSTNVQESVTITTEWKEFELLLTPDSTLTSPIFTIQTGTYASGGTVYYIDYVKVTEWQDPAIIAKVVNGNFDNNDGWALGTGATIAEGVLKLDNPNKWGEAALQAIPAKADTVYEITWKSKREDGTGAFNLFVMDGNNANLTKVGGQNWMNETSGDWVYNSFTVNTGASEVIKLKFSTEAENPGIILIDNIAIAEVKEGVWTANFNNGQKKFDKGDIVAEGPDGSNCFKWSAVGGYSATYTSAAGFKPSTDYIVTFKAKSSVAGGMGITIQNGDWANEYTNIPGGFRVTTEWSEYTLSFNTANYPNVYGAILFKFQDQGVAMDLYVDDIVITEGKASNLIANGDFETGAIAPWDNLWGGNTVEMVAGYNSDYAMKVTANGGWTHVRQTGIAVKPNTDYTITMYAKDASGYTLLIKDNGDSKNVAQAGLNAGAEWTPVTFTFNTGDNTSILFSFMSGAAGDTCTVDDVVLFEGVPEEPVVEFANGDFETGETAPWENLWNSATISFVEGYESNYAMQIVAPGQWNQVRQNKITVNPNSTYRLTAYVKDAQNMAFVIKTGDDKADMTSHDQCIFPAGNEWQKVTLEFSTDNQGVVYKEGGQPYDKDITSISILLISYEANGSVTVDNIVLEEVVPCEHEYESEETKAPTCTDAGEMTYTCAVCGDTYTESIDALGHIYSDCLDTDCDECGEVREPVGHILTHYDAAVAANCQETSHEEYWYCENCGCYFGDAEATWQHNPHWLFTPGECVRPEGIADCATVTCETCGNEIYGYGEHDTGVAACQTGTCSKCNAVIEGYGCANYDTPACEDGVCYYCGGFVAGFGHENGAWAACCDGECAYGCGLTYPAAEDHVDADADDYCDNCWSHLACVDEDGNGWCDICWREMPDEPVVEIIYGDADGDGLVTALDVSLLQQYFAGATVTMNEISADADGDGLVTALDVSLLQQYFAGWEVTLGPV